jgi:hypothetical protein
MLGLLADFAPAVAAGSAPTSAPLPACVAGASGDDGADGDAEALAATKHLSLQLAGEPVSVLPVATPTGGAGAGSNSDYPLPRGETDVTAGAADGQAARAAGRVMVVAGGRPTASGGASMAGTGIVVVPGAEGAIRANPADTGSDEDEDVLAAIQLSLSLSLAPE